MAPRLRPSTPADEPLFLALFASTRARELALMPTPQAAAAFVAQQVAMQQRATRATYPAATDDVILASDGTPCGRLVACRTPHELRLIDLVLLPAQRGRGLGRALVEGLQHDAREAGLPLVLHVEHGSPARQLYERLGFTVESEDQLRARMSWRAPVPQADA